MPDDEQKAEPPKKKRPRVPKKGSEIRKSPTYLLEIEKDIAFRLQRIDLFGLFMEGAIPMPLFAAVERIQATRQNMASDEALNAITSDDRGIMMETIRRVAVAVVKNPKMTHSKKQARADDLVWVGGKSDVPGEEHLPDQQGDVSSTALMLVYRAANNEAGLVVMADDEAEEFRPSEPTNVADVVDDEPVVPSSPVVVDLHAGASETSGDNAQTAREWKGHH